MEERLLSLLERIIPFRFLSLREKKRLINQLESHIFKKSDIIVCQNDSRDKRIFLLEEGVVESLDLNTDPVSRINVISEGHYFGERSVLFDQSSEYEIRALEPSICYSLPGDEFLRLLHTSRAFARSMGTILRDKQGVFSAFDSFTAELLRGISGGHIDIRKLLEIYKQLEPALHRAANNNAEFDFAALSYAVKRLPDNITRNSAFLLTDDLPTAFSDPDQMFQKIPTAARRRDVWEMLPGQSLVLLRSGLSDLIDFVTCLCLFAVEAKKIRYRLRHPGNLRALSEFLNRLNTNSDEEKQFLKSISFTGKELDCFYGIWPGEAASRLYQIAVHREMFGVDIRRQVNHYSRLSEAWTAQIGNAARELTGYSTADFPDDIHVHIISSNSHSVINCLNPVLVEKCDDIIAWVDENKGDSAGWQNKYDKLYAYAGAYLSANQETMADDLLRRNYGIRVLHKTASTGIGVQLISLDKLHGHRVDPSISRIPEDSKALIINIDYAFGEQAAEVISNLLLLFGKNLSSINIFGKAGSLVGKRGDILIPTAFIEQKNDHFYPILNLAPVNMERLKKNSGSTIHTGAMLTVAGTLLQNQRMLHFYRHIWNCLGLEMEGVYYYQEILKSSQIGVLKSGVPLRFFYYVSDLPLKRGMSLSQSLPLNKEIPPLYAITREILSEIIEQEKRELKRQS